MQQHRLVRGTQKNAEILFGSRGQAAGRREEEKVYENIFRTLCHYQHNQKIAGIAEASTTSRNWYKERC